MECHKEGVCQRCGRQTSILNYQYQRALEPHEQFCIECNEDLHNQARREYATHPDWYNEDKWWLTMDKAWKRIFPDGGPRGEDITTWWRRQWPRTEWKQWEEQNPGHWRGNAPDHHATRQQSPENKRGVTDPQQTYGTSNSSGLSVPHCGTQRWQQSKWHRHQRQGNNQSDQPPQKTHGQTHQHIIEQQESTPPTRFRGDRPILLANDGMHAKQEGKSGGKHAYLTQQALRQYCLQHDVWCVDLSNQNEWPVPNLQRFDWKTTILLCDKRSELIGDGITNFCFKLLRNVKDPNYPKPQDPSDTGERHVFECTNVNGNVWHLHYHNNGKYDPPYQIPYRKSIWDFAEWNVDENSDGFDECNITLSCADILNSYPEHNTPLGCKEFATALTKICSDDSKIYDITNMKAVHWHRWLKNLQSTDTVDYIGSGIVRVYAYNQGQKATIMFAHPGNTSTLVELTHGHAKARRPKYKVPNTQEHLRYFPDVVQTKTSWLRM